MLNIVALQGRLTATPDLRKTQNGTSVTSFTMAVQGSRKDQDGNYATNFVDCVAWSGTAEFMQRYLQKGALIAVTGELTTRTWQDQSGNKRKTTEVIVRTVDFCERAERSAPEPAPAPAAPAKEKQQHLPGADSATGFYPVDDDADIPF